MTTTTTERAIRQDIFANLSTYKEPGEVVEIRALDVINGPWRNEVSGYFNDYNKAADAVMSIGRASGIYFILNTGNRDLLSRCANRLCAVRGKDACTADTDIIRRRWLPIDFDPVRPSGISSTDAQHEQAIGRAKTCATYLKSLGWSDGILSDSGNGAHLDYRIDLPPDDGGLVQRVQESVAQRFDDDQVEVDTSVCNPARLWRLWGTWARKGDSTPDRPHRLCKLIDEPFLVDPVPRELLEAMAGPAAPPAAAQHQVGYGARIDVPALLARAGLAARGPEPWKDAQRWVFPVCPFNPDHTNSSEVFLQMPSGAVTVKCHHNGCRGLGWTEFKAKYLPVDLPPHHAGGNGQAKAAAAKSIIRGLVTIRASDVVRKKVVWVWPGRIARGKVNLWSGDPGLGKSVVSLDVGGRVSTGAGWPDAPGQRYEPAAAIVISAEDDFADTLTPRLDAAGADSTRIHLATMVRATDPETGAVVERVFTLADIPELERALLAMPDCILVIIDPVSAFLGRTDEHRNAEIRGVLAPLAALAAKYNVAILCIQHLNKSGAGPAMYRSLGSIGLVGAARSVSAFCKDKNDSTGKRRLMLPVKNNLTEDPPGLAYTVISSETGAPCVAWSAEPVNLTADEALAPPSDSTPGPDPEELERAVAWLTQFLGDGPHKMKDTIDVWVNAQNGSTATLNRAKKEIGVISDHPVNPGPWWWRLADHRPPTGAHHQAPEHLEPDDLENVPANKAFADTSDGHIIKFPEPEDVPPQTGGNGSPSTASVGLLDADGCSDW